MKFRNNYAKRGKFWQKSKIFSILEKTLDLHKSLNVKLDFN